MSVKYPDLSKMESTTHHLTSNPGWHERDWRVWVTGYPNSGVVVQAHRAWDAMAEGGKFFHGLAHGEIYEINAIPVGAGNRFISRAHVRFIHRAEFTTIERVNSNPSRKNTLHDYRLTGEQDCNNAIDMDDFDFTLGTPAQIVAELFSGNEAKEHWLEQNRHEVLHEGLDPDLAYAEWKRGWEDCAVRYIERHLDMKASKGDMAGNPPRGPREGARVKFLPTPASLALYSPPTPTIGATGSVTSVPFGGGVRRTFLPGPGGGLVYVKWDDFGVMGVSSTDIEVIGKRNPSSFTAKGERMYEGVKAGYGNAPRAKEIAARTVLSKSGSIPGLVNKNPDENFDTDILEGMTRSIWVVSYADWVRSLPIKERKKLSPGPGGDWDDVTPDSPPSALMAAESLYTLIEKANHKTPGELLLVAVRADGRDQPGSARFAESFGHHLAMQALGTGVSWFDDHGKFPLKVPHFEANYDGEELSWSPMSRSNPEGWIGARRELMHYLSVVNADKDESGNFLIDGANVIVGMDGDLVVPAATRYFVDGKPKMLAAGLRSTSYGMGVGVVNPSREGQ